MKKQLLIATFLVCSLLLMISTANAEDGKFYGKGYFNYNHDFSKDKGIGSGQDNSFEFTRIYFGYDKNLDDNFSIRFLMDVGYDVDAWRPYMKNAYLAMNCKLVEGAKWSFGMVPMPFQGVNVKHWGYRSVKTMAMDNWGSYTAGFPVGVGLPTAYARSWGSTADLGLRWDAMWNDMFGVEFAIANGAGYKNLENDMYKTIEFRPTVYLLDEKALVISAFVGYKAINDSSNSMVLSFMGGYTHQYFKIGAEYSMRTISKAYVAAPDVKDLSSSIISAWFTVMPTPKFSILGRYDMYDMNTENDKNIMYSDKDGASLMIFGIDYHPTDNVRFIPNVQIMTPQADDDPTTTMYDESASFNTFFLTLEYNW
ncbi:MAG: hypothetical protein NTW14_11965 [bacterium]|nr:hypothetical protein [bacterium]